MRYFSAGHVPAEICVGNAVQVIVQLGRVVFAVLMFCGRYDMLF